jgi:hypothetical protein
MPFLGLSAFFGSFAIRSMIEFKFKFKIQAKFVPPRLLFFVGMLIMCFSLNAQGPISDTIYQDDVQIDEIIKYGARDSSYYDVPSKKAYLFGGAYVETLTSKLNAGVIILDFEQHEVEASYILNTDSVPIEFPVFVESGETMTCKRMRMNTETQKVYIESLEVTQDELFFSMGVAKRYPSDQIHLKKGVLTTCDQEEPHYHFLLSKGVVVPEKRIVAGPMNLWISGIPTPIGLPFAFIPQQKERSFFRKSALWMDGVGTRNRTRIRHLNQIRKRTHCRCPPVRSEHFGNPADQRCASPDNHKNIHSHPFLDALTTRSAWMPLALVPFWDYTSTHASDCRVYPSGLLGALPRRRAAAEGLVRGGHQCELEPAR